MKVVLVNLHLYYVFSVLAVNILLILRQCIRSIEHLVFVKVICAKISFAGSYVFLPFLRADVSLRVSGSPTHLFKFEDIYQALKAGQGLTFSAISFLCAGGRETSYSGLGGHIPSNYAYDSKSV